MRRGLVRLIQLCFALAIAVPAGAATMPAVPAQASGVCYWSNVLSDYVTANPAWSVTYTSYVQYQIGYTCSLVPYETYVRYFSDTLTISNSDYVYHQTNAAALCGWLDSYYDCNGMAWYTNSVYACTGSCTVARSAWLGITIPYASTNTVWEHWAGADVHGGTWLETYHEFTSHRLYLYGNFYLG